MRRLAPFLLPLAVGLLSGCDPAPSTQLAPDQKPPDTSKMTPEQVDAMLKQNGGSGDRPK